MKNHILKTYFKLYLVLFLISFFFNSCQKDEIIVFDEIGVIAKSHKSVISYNDFLSQFYFLKSNTKSSFSLEKYKFGSDCSVYERNDSESIIKYIDTSSIVAFQYNNISTFTFKAETSIDSQNTFVNLVVSVTQDETSSVLLKYIPDETWINDTSLNYSGEIYQIDELGNTIANYSQSTSQNKSLNRTTTVCAFSVSTITITCTGIDHETGLPSNHSPGEGCTCGDSENSSCSPPYDYNFVSLYCVTVTTGGGDNSSESGSGGYYETSPTQNPDGTYNLPDAITPTDPILEFVSDNAVLSTLSQHLNLNIEDFNFLDANPKVARSLFNFLDNNDFTNASAVNSVYKVNEIFKGNTNSTILSTLYEHKSYLLIFGDYLTLTNFKLFPEFAEAYTDVANSDNLNLFDHQLISTKTDEIYTIIQQYSSIGRFSSISSMSDAHQQTIASNAVFTTSLSPVKSLTTGSYWPQTSEQWSAIGTIMGQFLLEIGLAVIPGSSIIDVTSGISEGDYLAVTLGVVGLVVDAFGGVIIKAISKIGKIIYKTFKIFKKVFKYLDEILNSIELGLKTDIVDDIVQVTDEVGNVLAHITDDILTFKYSGFGGDIVTNPNKTTTLIGKWQDPAGGGTKEIIESGLSKSGRNDGGLNALSETPDPSWNDQQIWDNINQPWLDDAIQNADVIRAVSNPLDKVNIFKNGTDFSEIPDSVFNSSNSLSDYLSDLSQADIDNLSFYGKEVKHLFENGYTYNMFTNQFTL